MLTGPPARYRELIDAATRARERAYAPYSRFPVGAALLTTRGDTITGCNVENASFGLTVCAERNAVFAAVAAARLAGSPGGPAIAAIAVVAASDGPVFPCGACRQVLHEFGPGCVVIAANLAGHVTVVALAELLPRPFGPWQDLAAE